ncbi:TrkH family potassium uptake protein [Chishuiella sp.]|uniref:TrkH family potassium uptake protein n=1 Tax=Chishuiella sp. TaxID=1969467 RepID=UPI0028B001E8|nr:TrkH family potassium uptake protein [Chishuiella sp.]
MKSLNFKVILNLSGVLLLLNALFMLIATCVSIYFGDHLSYSFFFSGCLVGIGGLLMVYFTKDGRKHISKREGYIVVCVGWLFLILSGCLPYVSSLFFLPNDHIISQNFSVVNIIYETVSGYTATGTSIYDNVESLPKSILFWRSTTNWIGGMGIIVLTIAILPFLGIGGRQLFMAEAPGIHTDKIHPRITETAKNLWLVYLGLTLFFATLLYFGGMNLFDATNHAMSVIATAGFSTKNEGVMYWNNNIFIQYVFIFMMFLGGTNFALIYLMIKGQFKKIWNNEEFRWWVGLILITTFIIFLALFYIIYPNYSIETYSWTNLEHSFRNSLFHVVSISSTTALAMEDYTNWLSVTTLIFFALFFIGGSAGSTSGGITVIRHVILLKNSWVEFKRILHPNAIIPVRYNKRSLHQSIVFHVMAFFVMYMIIWIISSILFGLLNYGVTMSFQNILTSLTITASTLGNIGPGIGEFGPGTSMNALSDGAKLLCSFLMVLGRLELFTILILFTPAFWRNT